MAYQWSATRQHRAATAPAPSKAPIPPSLIPGRRHHHTFSSGTNTVTNGSLSFGPSTGFSPMVQAPATAYTPGGDARDYFSMNPSPYHDFQLPPPPLPMPQSLLPQSIVPPLPPKAPVIMSHTTTPTLPPKPPPFTPPPNFLPPPVLPRSRSQPPPPMPRAPAPPHLPPPPRLPTLPPKPLGARSASLAVMRSPHPQPPARPNVSPRARPSSTVEEPNDTALPPKPLGARSPSLAMLRSPDPQPLARPNVSPRARPSSIVEEPNNTALPPKPLGARSPSLAMLRSPDPQPLARPNVSPRARPSSIVKEPNDTALPLKPLGARSPSLAMLRSPDPQPLARPNVSPRARPSSIVEEPNDTALPPKPLGARSPSLAVIRSHDPQPLAQPNVSPRARPSSIVQEPNDTALPTMPSAKSPAEGPSGMNEEQEFELALKLSEQTERERAKRANAFLLAQDEDLARALEESYIDSAPRSGPSGSRPGPLNLDNENIPSSSSTIPRDASPRSEKPVSRNVTLLPVDEQLKEDEELARRLEAEYDSEPPSPTPETNQRVDPNPSEGPPLPRYADIVGKETEAVNRLESDTTASPHAPQVQLNSARSHERLSNPDQVNTPPRSTPSPAQRTSPRPESQTTTASQEEAEAPENSPTSSPQPPRPVVTPNHFVEPELLYGASFGDHPPPVENVRFRGGLPNALALPYGKGQPMHIRASSWRQLVKLLAKLSAAQIEPTVEARAETKGALRLRTVVQFFKPHPSSTDWRTVIYLTIDCPRSPDHRHTNEVVNSLPYSYSLSTLPAMLRDGPDSSLSKYYTIPATSRTPYPKLPVSMPDMAMYLAEALEDSRRVRGRLAKMINQFYPNQQAQVASDEDDEKEPRGRGRVLLGRLMGRPSRPPHGGGHNAEMYDVVTPFVSEWG